MAFHCHKFEALCCALHVTIVVPLLFRFHPSLFTNCFNIQFSTMHFLLFIIYWFLFCSTKSIIHNSFYKPFTVIFSLCNIYQDQTPIKGYKYRNKLIVEITIVSFLFNKLNNYLFPPVTITTHWFL